METLSGYLSAAVALLAPYWGVVVLGIGVVIFLAIIAAITAMLLPVVINFLTANADRIKSEQVRTRLHDAIEKFNMVALAILQQSSELAKKEYMEIIADGKVEKAELMGLAGKFADMAMAQLNPELATFKKYFAGEAVKSLFTNFFITKIEDFVNKKLGRDTLTADTVATPFH
jgi:hypothetical protein